MTIVSRFRNLVGRLLQGSDIEDTAPPVTDRAELSRITANPVNDMPTPRDVQFSLPGLPPELAAEEEVIKARRTALGLDMNPPVAGLALSGGGIRSATFSLGILREMGNQGLLHRFDYLSTVSGGSYIGAYYCGLFAKRGEAKPVMTADNFELPSTSTEQCDPFAGRRYPQARASIEWLRQSGRYLAPAGSGDYLYATALLVRNWLAIQLVIGSMVLLAALFGATARFGADYLSARHAFLPAAPRFVALYAPLLIGLCVPAAALTGFGWAYWLTQRDLKDGMVKRYASLAGTVLILAATAWLGVARQWPFALWAAGLALIALTMWLLSLRVAIGTPGAEQRWDARRQFLTRALVWPSRLLLLIMFLGITDALGYWIFGLSIAEGSVLQPLLASPLVAAVAVPLGRVLLTRLLGGSSTTISKRWTPMLLKAGIAGTAFVLTAAVMMFWTVVAYKVAWPTSQIPARISTAKVAQKLTIEVAPAEQSVKYFRSVTAAASSGGQTPWRWSSGQKSTLGADDHRRAVEFLRLAGGLLGTLLVIGLCIAMTPAFLNLSSLANFYAGRLRRAYLGAGNRRRLPDSLSNNVGGDLAVDVSDADDDILLQDYYHRPSADCIDSAGQPLHLINITLNETSSKGSNVVQRDRHGRNFVMSPTGIYYTDNNDRRVQKIDWWNADIEQLPLSAWVGISGAAFSTGLGNRTSLPLALLAGLTNIRLGYWWRSNRRKSRERSTQSYLVDEITGKFSGPDQRRWYLSDGGHFENTGAYELIRRRVPFIVVSDNGADERYQYEDVANLVRKARIDFGAEIEFLSHTALDKAFAENPTARKSFGTLAQIAGQEPAAPGAVAALARTTYGEGDHGSLVLIKPRLIGDGPEDLMRYHAANSAFPQQTTLDQFFDEAQWESYYVLGRRIAQAIFGGSGTQWPPQGMGAPCAVI